ncbi:supporter of activation of yellow protein [Musca domestica]|uniref:Supporter of activation of yellow protein n=2 Tax=Musca domestica TaxID=7370 RepID=A0ABM3V231_MUSDO|nr:supporter of activation of yellow protein [Musca domestica]XP_058979848.1 supporter of activation of yellow protein [Musca domestica]
MSVTNRRKSTDSETNSAARATNDDQRHQQLLSYISCRQAATASKRNNRSGIEEDQEQLVTSTSTDILLPLQAEGEGEEVSIDLETVVTSSVRISSTSNNYGNIADSLEELNLPSTSGNARAETQFSSLNRVNAKIINHRSMRPLSNEMGTNDSNVRVVNDTLVRVSNRSPTDGNAGLNDRDDQSTSSNNNVVGSLSHGDKNKIKLKLPKLTASESHDTASNDEDIRKVEPLKINLLSTQHHSTNNAHHTPKIIFKPIMKEPANEVLISSEECSSSAEDEIVSNINISDPHILPKLTIRSKNEDNGSSHTTVVPKLTIKINDTTSIETQNSTSAANTPPLPKLTIKTGTDGHTESIISNISPASSTTSASSSVGSSSLTSPAVPSSPAVSTTLTLPKFTIKPLPKANEQPSIPKFCIKTNMLCTEMSEDSALSKIPKLTIKTGQEHAVIITQRNDHMNAAGIPKLTIKTKSLDIPDDTSADTGSAVMEKIPKLTIKTNMPNETLKSNKIKGTPEASPDNIILESPKQQAVPKITISRQSLQMDKQFDNREGVTKMTIKSLNHSDFSIKYPLNRPSSTEESGISDDAEQEDYETEHNKTVPKLTIKNLGSPQLKIVADAQSDLNKNANPSIATAEVDDFSDLLNVENVGEESSNSQEFCGFNDQLVNDCSAHIAMANERSTNIHRNSDDMDIDESLKMQHEPQIFQNASHMKDKPPSTTHEAECNGGGTLNEYPKTENIIDTVDLTSSAGSSPAQLSQFDYNDDEEERKSTALCNDVVPSTSILMERLQRETSVIKKVIAEGSPMDNTPTLPMANPANNSSTSLKYPQLTERLLTNGSTLDNLATSLTQSNSNSEENIIDSIEILDSPECSSQNSSDAQFDNTCSTNVNKETQNGLRYTKEAHLLAMNNNNVSLKRQASLDSENSNQFNINVGNGLKELPSKLRKLENDNYNTGKTVSESNSTHRENFDENFEQDTSTPVLENNPLNISTISQTGLPIHQRLRKQKHEHLLPIPADEVGNTIQSNSEDDVQCQNDNSTPIIKKRGRPKKSDVAAIPSKTKEETTTNVTANAVDNKSRRVQLLRKRLAIDMVDAEQPIVATALVDSVKDGEGVIEHQNNVDAAKRERNLRTPLRTSRRSNTPNTLQIESRHATGKLIAPLDGRRAVKEIETESDFNHFLESNSSVSSVSSHTSSTANVNTTTILNSASTSMPSQIDLTMSSSSSSSNGSTTNTITTVEATSMLPPTTILSSDPLPDVVFQPNDFSSMMATQQLNESSLSVHTKSRFEESQNEEVQGEFSGADNSEDDSTSSSTTLCRGRGRLRGVRGGRTPGRGNRPHNLGRGSTGTAKSIAMNRPRCVGALKHTPDPERIKGLYSPAPQVFEEDTRMSADLSHSSMQPQSSPLHTSQPDFYTNEESQSSVISNNSILDSNISFSSQSASTARKPMKKKKMEVCVAEDAEFTVASIAEYDWPPPKGCCPSKNRDTFMIQEQVAMYLGIKSFKRKYPELPRRQIDMEERNWLQEKGLVTEKMCDLGITAVWASDILDIMYTDFYDKYEEYKDFVRQKHLREIEAKQKSLGLNVAGRGLQARERALLSTSKWNSYFNRTRKDERLSFLDLQTLVVNKPCPRTAPISTVINRPVADAVALAAKAENIAEPPTLLQPRICEPRKPRDSHYPLSLVPGQFCEKYYNYSALELRKVPLNTILELPFKLWQDNGQENNSSDTDSATESVDNKVDLVESRTLSTKRQNKRCARLNRPYENSFAEFKIPPIPGTSASTRNSSGSSSSDESSSESDSDSSCSSSSLSSEDVSDEEDSPAICAVCLRPHNRNLNDMPELFVQCYTCRRKVHPSCIEMPRRMTLRVRNYNWQCADCKCCIKCKQKQDGNKMLYCEQCDRGFHIYCLGIKAVPEGRWSCNRCSICMRCGATTPEGIPSYNQLLNSPSGDQGKQHRHKRLKWVNEYRVDPITKVKEHTSMLCVPCAKMKATKRNQASFHNISNGLALSPGARGSDPSSSPGVVSSMTPTLSADAAYTETTTEDTASSIGSNVKPSEELSCSEKSESGMLLTNSKNAPPPVVA